MRSWRDSLRPVRMDRIAVVAPADRMRAVLVRLAGTGTVEFDDATPAPAPEAVLSVLPPPATGRPELLAGEAALRAHSRASTTRDEVSAIAGWAPADTVGSLSADLAAVDGAVVVLSRPRGVEIPSMLRPGGVRGSLGSLVETYGTVPYRDVDPTPVAVGAFLLMFGMMFGDVGHGALLLLIAAALAFWHRLARFRRAWPFAAGTGLAGIVFGALYGEFFGPTGVLPALWLRPLERPATLMAAAVFVGAALLAGALALGTVNRVREAGWRAALYASSGIAGVALFAGLAVVAAGWYASLVPLVVLGAVLASLGMVLIFVGFTGEGGVFEACVELFDTVLGLGSNVASFTRLAAFGLTHAALGSIVWAGARALWPRGTAGAAGAVAVFVAGNLLAFALEGLVVAVQALRLEYYELFSRVFQAQGRPFRPWRLPVITEEVSPWPHGSPASR
ncbi:V-type ATPase 116kDa subunit family protein [Actinoallomurus iriomotensis]|nr:V-type ATPase 116kDa subunit family protein [Actinoallomurus iriomotensis]